MQLSFPPKILGYLPGVSCLLCQRLVRAVFLHDRRGKREDVYLEFHIHTIRGVVLGEEEICLDLIGQEQAWLEAVYAWVKAHPIEIDYDAFLTRASIDQFLVLPDRSCFIGRQLPGS